MPNNSSARISDYTILTVLAIGAITAYRIFYLFDTPFDLFFDEAQYWFWSQSPEWGYYSKPPVIAWTIALTTGLFDDHSISYIRLASPLYHALTAWMIYLSATHLYTKHIGFWSALTYSTLPAISLSSSLISTDPALLFFWSSAFWCFLKARDSNKLYWWALAGLAAGFGMLSKYNMLLFLPSVLLALYLSPKHHHLLKHKGIWIASATTLLLFLPNILWNASHHFVSFLHTKDNVNFQEDSFFHISELLAFISAQFGIFGPIPAVTFIIILLKRTKHPIVDYHTLLSFIWPMLAVITTVSLLSRAHANWAAPIYITATILVTAWLVQHHYILWLKLSVALHITLALLVMHFHTIIDISGIQLSGRATDLTTSPITLKDPYKRVKGWKAMSNIVEKTVQNYPESIIISDERKIASPLHYYLNYDKNPEQRYTIVKWNANDVINDHYELIDQVSHYPDRNALYITRNDTADNTDSLFAHYTHVTKIASVIIPYYTDFEQRYSMYYLENYKH